MNIRGEWLKELANITLAPLLFVNFVHSFQILL